MRKHLQLTAGTGAIGLLVALAIASSGPEPPSMGPQILIEKEEMVPSTGFVRPTMHLPHLTGRMLPDRFRSSKQPSRWDWRESAKVTSVKNQRACGSCYAFASMANVESKMLIDDAGTFDFSENNAKECNWYETSCSGGNYYQMASWFSKEGTVLESCDPYVAADVPCNSSCPYVKTLLDWRIISTNSVPSTGVLQSYIYNRGPVYTTLYAGDGNDPDWRDEFADYDGSYTLHYAGSWQPNHAVLIVGWDDGLTHAGGTGAWIVKNSWGTSWGGTCGYGSEEGYFTIAYGSANLGMWSSYIDDWHDYDENGELLYYDDGGWTTSWGYGNTTAWGLCAYVPSSVSNITRVEFWTNDVTNDIDVYIYDSFDGSTLDSLLSSRLNTSYDEAGYHSVALDSPIEIAAGNWVYAVVKFTNATYTYPVAADNQGLKETGATYISPDGSNGSWFDLGTAGYENDVAIRLRASNTQFTVTSPNGSEDWEVGSVQTVTWESVGPMTEAKLDFSLDGGTHWMTIIAATPDDGSHPWAIPHTPSDNCVLRISDPVDGNPLDVSDSSFTLSDKTPPSRVTGLQASGTDSSIALDWLPATDNVGVHHYIVYRDTTSGYIPEPGDSVGVSLITTYSDLAAVSGITYYYRISAVDSSNNEGDYSDQAHSSITTDIDIDWSTASVQSVVLMQNFPNPFNPVTEIDYYLPTDCYVTLEILNLLGQRVVTLVDERQRAGYRSVRWTARSLKSGWYFYRLQADTVRRNHGNDRLRSFTEIKKMLIVR